MCTSTFSQVSENFTSEINVDTKCSNLKMFDEISASFLFLRWISGALYYAWTIYNRAFALKKSLFHCFKWVVLSALHPVEEHTERVSNYEKWPSLKRHMKVLWNVIILLIK